MDDVGYFRTVTGRERRLTRFPVPSEVPLLWERERVAEGRVRVVGQKLSDVGEGRVSGGSGGASVGMYLGSPASCQHAFEPLHLAGKMPALPALNLCSFVKFVALWKIFKCG